MKLHNKKTGEDGCLMMCHDYDEYPLFVAIGCIRTYYHTFADMVKAGWDCIKIPAEPLIKDEKIRKAVRAWAEALDLRWFRRCSSVNAYTSRLTGHNAEGVCYTMELKPKDLYGDKITKDSYTLAELCGEEE